MARRAVILAALAAFGAAGAAAQPAAEKKRELAQIQSELRRTLQELDALRSSEDSLGRDVDRLQGLDAKSRRRVQSLQGTIRDAEKRRADLEARLAAAGRVDGFWSAALSAETARRAAAEASRSDFYGVDELWAEEYRRLAIMEKVRHLRGLQGYARRTEADEARAGRSADALAASRRRAQAERDGRRRAYEAKKAELARTQSRVAEAARRAVELAENAKALTALVARLGKAGAKLRPPAPGTAALARPRHSLPWPVSGRVLTGFGREKDPELGTWIVRQGLTLATAADAAVRAIADGHVIFAGAFRSYGNVVIVDHGAGFFSIYGSLGAIAASKGARLAAGTRLASAGPGPDGTGRVYLEIRRGTQALDPKTWLQNR